jgi:hypothetical protein
VTTDVLRRAINVRIAELVAERARTTCPGLRYADVTSRLDELRQVLLLIDKVDR